MKKYLLTILAVVLSITLFAQTFALKENQQFTSDKISVLNITPDKITIKVYYKSSARCACEEEEVIEILKNDKGEFKYDIFGDPENTIKLSLEGIKLASIEVLNNQDYNCCSIKSGKYYLNSVAIQTFDGFWVIFQKNMGVKDYSLKNISFPYSYSCNYLGQGEISRQQFEKEGTEIFVNGNAYISNTFYEGNLILSVGKYNGGYINDYLKEQFLSKYGNLSDIYFVAEEGNENDSIGYKAYFLKIDNEFKFIGFEGIEKGD